jgi:hypothetical protein
LFHDHQVLGCSPANGSQDQASPDGTLDKYKARWVLRGDTQRPGLDFEETFMPVVKPATIRTVLTLIASKD